jgi:signal recognition particle receptor subunit beta
MPVINLSSNEIQYKIVYYGAALCGKTTNLKCVHDMVLPESRSELVTAATATDRTLFFDFLALELGSIHGLTTRLALYTVPGQVEYEQSRKLILRNVDGIVFVVDSSAERRTANQEALIGMITNLKELGVSLDKIPWVLQYNKQDLADAMTSEQINRDLNGAKVPFFEAIATTGKGVFATLKGMTKLVCRLDTLQDD